LHAREDTKAIPNGQGEPISTDAGLIGCQRAFGLQVSSATEQAESQVLFPGKARETAQPSRGGSAGRRLYFKLGAILHKAGQLLERNLIQGFVEYLPIDHSDPPRVTHRKYLFVRTAMRVASARQYSKSMKAKRMKRSVLEDANALKEALYVHCALLTAEDKSQVAAKALLNSFINERSSMEEIVTHILPSVAKRTRRLGLTRRSDRRKES